VKKLPLGVLFQTICPVMSDSARQSCLDDWQNCQANWLKDFAHRHKLLPTLEYCLQRHQMWDEVPADIQVVIQESRKLHGLRQLKILSQLAEMDVALSQAGEEAVLLKGSALYHYSIYPNLGSRMNADMDILVAPNRVPSIVAVFRSLGYTFQGGYDPNRHYDHHLPPLVRPNSIHVEIHPLQSGRGKPIHRRMLETAEPIEGFSALRLPVATELFWHMALHARFCMPQLRNLLDLHRLRSLYDVDELLLANRAQDEGLEQIWSIMMSQLAEFERGEPAPQTIQTWEWRPSPKFDGVHGVWRSFGWSSLFKPVSRYSHRLIVAMLFLPAIPLRLFRFSGLMREYFWCLLESTLVKLMDKSPFNA
jgi:Uncharacterised nucleotidyltransferase